MYSNCTAFNQVWLFYGPLHVLSCDLHVLSCTVHEINYVAMSIEESRLKSKVVCCKDSLKQICLPWWY